MRETRTVHFKVDPALGAYLAWIEDTGREFDFQAFDVFAAGYRAARQSEDARELHDGEGV